MKVFYSVSSPSPSKCHSCAGSLATRKSEITDNATKVMYARFPPARFSSIDTAKRDVAIAGPIVRMIDIIVWASPLTDPRERWEGVSYSCDEKLRSSALDWVQMQ